jgi:hypothetical protein
LKLLVGILNPHPKPAVSLKKVSPKFHLKIEPAHLAASQFPPAFSDAHGNIHKPSRW